MSKSFMDYIDVLYSMEKEHAKVGAKIADAKTLKALYYILDDANRAMSKHMNECENVSDGVKTVQLEVYTRLCNDQDKVRWAFNEKMSEGEDE